ncbi:MAG TPA: carboxypeptidase-like regulatory domain-containing protein [Gemmatimonadaceae bacterium]
MRDSLMMRLFVMRLTMPIAFCVASATAAVTVGAQTPAGPAAGFVTIEGVALDSLHSDYLRGALIVVEGANKTAITDSLGRFRLDSVPPGLRRISVVHPTLDTVGIALQTPPLQLSAGQHLHLDLATPSARTVVMVRCTTAERTIGAHALFGVVQFAETEAPAAGAKVMLEWMEYESGGNSLLTTPRRRVATVGDNGRFRICGLPSDFTATLTAARGSDTTAAVLVHLNSLANTAGLELAEPDEPLIASGANPGAPGSSTGASVPRRRGVLTGRVLDKAGVPLSRVRVSVDGDTAFAMSGSDGRFTLRNVRPGTRSIMARRLGFEPADAVVGIHSASPTDITVRLGDFIPVLDTVRITAPAVQLGLEKVGFTKRKNIGTGYYLTPEEINRSNAMELPDLLTMAPMLRRQTVDGHQVIVGRPQGGSNGCVNYIVDGVPWTGGGIEDFIHPSEIGAIEVYSTGFTPGQFMSATAQCETVAIWTKMKLGVR